MTYRVAIQAAAVERVVVNSRAFLERRSADKRWPESDLDRERRLLAALEDAALTLRRLSVFEQDARFSELIREIVE